MIARAAVGCVAARNGSTKTSVSQKTCPRYAWPDNPRGADSRFAVIGNRCHQVEQRDPGCELQVLVALDADVGFGPAFRPGPPLFAEQPLEPSVTRLGEARTRGIRSLRFDVDRLVHGNAIDVTISARLLDGRDGDGTACTVRNRPLRFIDRSMDHVGVHIRSDECRARVDRGNRRDAQHRRAGTCEATKIGCFAASFHQQRARREHRCGDRTRAKRVRRRRTPARGAPSGAPPADPRSVPRLGTTPRPRHPAPPTGELSSGAPEVPIVPSAIVSSVSTARSRSCSMPVKVRDHPASRCTPGTSPLIRRSSWSESSAQNRSGPPPMCVTPGGTPVGSTPTETLTASRVSGISMSESLPGRPPSGPSSSPAMSRRLGPIASSRHSRATSSARHRTCR